MESPLRERSEVRGCRRPSRQLKQMGKPMEGLGDNKLGEHLEATVRMEKWSTRLAEEQLSLYTDLVRTLPVLLFLSLCLWICVQILLIQTALCTFLNSP